jgi:hypothetical protein
MRGSAPTSVAMGTRPDDGASVSRKNTPR